MDADESAAETAAKLIEKKASRSGGDGSTEVKFSLQSFHLFSWSHLSLSRLVSVTPPQIQVSQFHGGHASCLRQSIRPLCENGLLSSSRAFSFGQLGSFALTLKLLLGGCEKQRCVDSTPPTPPRLSAAHKLITTPVLGPSGPPSVYYFQLSLSSCIRANITCSPSEPWNHSSNQNPEMVN